jgi:hypothetical protein
MVVLLRDAALRRMHSASYLVVCGGVRSSAQQRKHHEGVPPAGCQVQRRAPILQPYMQTSECIRNGSNISASVHSALSVGGRL